MIAVTSAILVLVGAAFSLLAAVGILRMPDFYSRIQASAKASTLGVGCVLVAAALHFQDPGTRAGALLVGAFLALTTPIAAQLLGRAAYADNVPMWHETIVDELKADTPHSPATSGDAGHSREED